MSHREARVTPSRRTGYRRSRAAALFPAALLAAALLAACGGRPAAPAPNVIFVTADSLRADHTSLIGYERPTTPRLERLAREAVVYAAAHAQASWTRPSYASMLTSLWTSDLALLSRLEGRVRPESNDLPYENPLGLPERVPTLATRLAESGYRYAAVGLANNGNLAADWNFDRGFERWDWRAGWMAEKVLAQALAALDELAARPGPFLLFVHFQQTHFPFRASGPFFDRFREPGDPELNRQFIKRLMAGHGKVIARGPWAREFGSAERQALLRRALINLYDASIAEVDSVVGRLVDSLRSRGLFENSLIVFNSDHGEEFLDHGRWGHGHELYQELIHVPLLVKYPARLGVEPQRVERPVSNLDLLPTILAAAGLPEPAEALAGRDLRPSPALRRHPHPIAERGPSQKAGRAGLLAIRGPRYKLLLTVEDPDERRFSEVAFDLIRDPGERDPLPPGAPEVASLRRELMAWLQTHRWSVADVTPDDVEAHAPEISEETLRELRALGYLE